MAPGVHFTLPPPKGGETILTDAAIDFLVVLHRTFNARRLELLENRKKVQAELDAVRCSALGGRYSADRRRESPSDSCPRQARSRLAIMGLRSSCPGLEDRR